MINGRRQPSRGGTSRISREAYVRFCEGLGVKFPGPTRHDRLLVDVASISGLLPKAAVQRTTMDGREVPQAVISRRSFNHPIGNRKQCGRHLDAEPSCCL